MPRFVVIGQKATASDDFLLDDLPGTSGRLDVLLRCLRAALLFSHGLRRDVVVYLVLCGGRGAPRVMRVDGGEARFIRPDERSLATLAKKLLERGAGVRRGFAEMRPGIAIADGGLDEVIDDLGALTPYVLEESGPDVRDAEHVGRADAVFFVGDHLGFDATTRARLAALGAVRVGVGPVSLHADDAIAILTNEIDRRRARESRPGG
ncbi:MAG: tRNA (pseudouridine(54)-N(1))-methyltransferase TrmY [Myxococcota bacterium]|nr:tRNA (pseudouridine(54)-N(1))-methyltransferase TrmY [Myxococcota bacterium]